MTAKFISAPSASATFAEIMDAAHVLASAYPVAAVGVVAFVTFALAGALARFL